MKRTFFTGLAGAAAANLELRLTGASAADAAGQSRERIVLLLQPRQGVFELRQLDLQLSVA